MTVSTFQWSGLALPAIAWPSPLSGLTAMSRLPARERAPDTETDDALLVARAARGDQQAFDQLHSRHVDFVWSRLTRLCGPDPDREDLTQQIFLEVYRGLARFRGEASFRSYLHRVVVRHAYDHLRRRRKRPQPIDVEAIELLSAPDASPEARAVARQRLALTWAALDRIKAKKRVAFLLRVVDGLSLEEVATLVGASLHTVAKRVKHAQDELARMLLRRTQEREGRA